MGSRANELSVAGRVCVSDEKREMRSRRGTLWFGSLARAAGVRLVAGLSDAVGSTFPASLVLQRMRSEAEW